MHSLLIELRDLANIEANKMFNVFNRFTTYSKQQRAEAFEIYKRFISGKSLAYDEYDEGSVSLATLIINRNTNKSQNKTGDRSFMYDNTGNTTTLLPIQESDYIGEGSEKMKPDFIEISDGYFVTMSEALNMGLEFTLDEEFEDELEMEDDEFASTSDALEFLNGVLKSK